MAKVLRFRFTRGPQLKYLSHLDVLRVFERALRRSQLPVEYTQGFNPRMRIVFGLPMSTGLTSEAEYADIVLQKDVTCDDFVSILNENMPAGMEILEAVELTGQDNIMKQIEAALYSIIIETDKSEDEINSMISEIFSQDELKVMKRTKRGVRPVNIRPLIYKLEAVEKGNNVFELIAFVSAGLDNNLRADLLMEAIIEKYDFNVKILSIHRKALYTKDSNGWKDPFEVSDGERCNN
ncbi:MAG: DUF2344 domain-containing protein [Clostridiaceae bacterium]|nr:DUF2344 domain-containing protein [Clostridiaceae bacterium]